MRDVITESFSIITLVLSLRTKVWIGREFGMKSVGITYDVGFACFGSHD
jgi:hypothetical protein